MSTSRTLTIELRASEHEPPDILQYVDDLYGCEHHAFRYLGNLVLVDNNERCPYSQWGPEHIELLHSDHREIERCATMRANDTGNTCRGKLYWFRDGKFQVVDDIFAASNHPPLRQWSPMRLDEFAGKEIPFFTNGPQEQREVQRILELEHGFYTPTFVDIAYGSERPSLDFVSLREWESYGY